MTAQPENPHACNSARCISRLRNVPSVGTHELCKCGGNHDRLLASNAWLRDQLDARIAEGPGLLEQVRDAYGVDMIRMRWSDGCWLEFEGDADEALRAALAGAPAGPGEGT